MSLKRPLPKDYGHPSPFDPDDEPMSNPCYKRVEVYQTADGKQHATPQEAEEHAADCCREILDARLWAVVKDKGRFSRNDMYQIIMALVPDGATGRELAGELGKVFIE